MLTKSQLYFSRITEFDDPYEGTMPYELAIQIAERSNACSEKLGYGIAASSAAISCWHMNEDESMAMWKLYVSGPEGVAIQTTMEKLKRIEESSDFLIGKVNYLGHETEPPKELPPAHHLKPYSLLLQKRRCYAHEEEVRIVIMQPADMNNPYQTRIPEERVSWRSGFGVSIDLPNLIERIVVSPDYPSYGIPALQKAVDCAGVRIDVQSSDTLKPPNRECEEALQKLLGTIKTTK